mmetsp:Transcript_65/g.174  ORF Transcript_65/g.174 Transcript_65/m.174 type:complete len:210 (-) Transcript_65:610-1239(-)
MRRLHRTHGRSFLVTAALARLPAQCGVPAPSGGGDPRPPPPRPPASCELRQRRPGHSRSRDRRSTHAVDSQRRAKATAELHCRVGDRRWSRGARARERRADGFDGVTVLDVRVRPRGERRQADDAACDGAAGAGEDQASHASEAAAVRRRQPRHPVLGKHPRSCAGVDCVQLSRGPARRVRMVLGPRRADGPQNMQSEEQVPARRRLGV